MAAPYQLFESMKRAARWMRRPGSIAFTFTLACTLYSPQPTSPASARASLPPLTHSKTLVPLLVPPSAALSAWMLQVPCVTFHFAAPLSKWSMNSVPSGVPPTMPRVPPAPVPAVPPVHGPLPPDPAVPEVPAVPGFAFEPPPELHAVERRKPRPTPTTLRFGQNERIMDDSGRRWRRRRTLPHRCFVGPGPAHRATMPPCFVEEMWSSRRWPSSQGPP